MPAAATLAQLTVVVPVLVMLATASVVPPVPGLPRIMMLSPALKFVVLATVNVRSAELLTFAVR